MCSPFLVTKRYERERNKKNYYVAVFRNVFEIEGLGLKRDIDLSSKHLNLGPRLWAKEHVYG